MDEDKRITVGHWLTKAENDMEMAQRALEWAPIITDMACFHAQQCAEKSLKAFLVFMDSHVDQIHDLGKLVGKCDVLDPSFSNLHPLVAGMTRYAVKDRYTDDWREIL
ncbi:MAG: HEPN domain-containing protein [Nitrospinae bacterium]|nr:HEPN domain-containing protein [Nitrospinota bacterium]